MTLGLQGQNLPLELRNHGDKGLRHLQLLLKLALVISWGQNCQLTSSPFFLSPKAVLFSH